MTPPLAGIRVLDVSHNLAGPLAAMHLADLGADVVKVERPSGDEWRDHEGVPGHPGRSRHYLQVNRGKRSVALDLATDGGREAIARLVAWADVLVTNLRTGVPERLGIGWERCHAINPRLVWCHMTAFGSEGPLAARRGYDMVVEARAGFLVDGLRPEDPPRSSQVPINDTALPLLAGMNILAALLERERSGLGQRIDLSLLQCAVALNAHSLVRLDDVADPPEVRFCRAFYRTYRTADGWLAIAAYAERLARALCAALDLPALLDEPRFATKADRVRNEDALAAILAERLATRTTADWEGHLAEAGVPAGPVNPRDDLFEDPQVAALGLLETVRDPELGRVTMMGPAARLSRTPARVGAPGRHLGADTRSTLAEAGLTSSEIDALIASGAALQRADPA